MRKRLVIFLLLAALMGGLAWIVWPRNEPHYQNWPASRWVDLPGYDAYYLGYFPKADTNAIPYLVAGLRRHTSTFDGVYTNVYNHSIPWLRRHLHMHPPREFKDWRVRASAAEILGQLGTNSPDAIAGLVRVLKQEKTPLVKVNAIESLQKIGQGNDAVEQAIILALQDRAPEVRDAAEDALRQLDPATAKKLIK